MYEKLERSKCPINSLSIVSCVFVVGMAMIARNHIKSLKNWLYHLMNVFKPIDSSKLSGFADIQSLLLISSGISFRICSWRRCGFFGKKWNISLHFLMESIMFLTPRMLLDEATARFNLCEAQWKYNPWFHWQFYFWWDLQQIQWFRSGWS